MTDDPNLEEVYRIESAIKRLKVSRAWVYQIIKDGRLASFKIGGCRYVSERAIRDFLNAAQVVK